MNCRGLRCLPGFDLSAAAFEVADDVVRFVKPLAMTRVDRYVKAGNLQAPPLLQQLLSPARIFACVARLDGQSEAADRTAGLHAKRTGFELVKRQATGR